MKATHSTYDVIISGAGPVGLFLACELALAKCSVLVLEKSDDLYSPLKQLPFGLRGLNAPSIEALYRRGLLKEFELHKSFKIPHANSIPANDSKPKSGGHFAGIQFNVDSYDSLKWRYRVSGSTPVSLVSSMEEVEMILTNRAAALGVEIRRGCAVTDLNQTEEGVVITTSHSATFKGKWIVGCDGSRSTVRKLSGFEFEGTEPEFTGYTAQVEIADPEKLHSGRILTPNGMYLQSQPGYLILQDFDGGAFHSLGTPVTKEHFQEVLRRISGTNVTINALHIATTWTDRSRQATTYRNGRVFLAGDAAHIHSPLGGQGLNLGLGDAMNLGWKLAKAIHNNASEGLLDSYFTERHPIGAQVLDWSRAQVAIMKPEPSAKALHAVFKDLMNTEDGAAYIAGRVWGLFTHYYMEGDHPLIGYSVPNFEFEEGVKIGELMHDGKGLLLDFTGHAALKALVPDKNQLKYVTGTVKDSLGLKALLVRPDGIVVWATDRNIANDTLISMPKFWK